MIEKTGEEKGGNNDNDNDDNNSGIIETMIMITSMIGSLE